MNKARINILIVEDDETQGKALYEAFSRAGYTAVLSQTADDALTQARRTEFHCMLVDCMLPKMNGVVLVETVLKMIPNKPKIFLITGIFKDRKFMKEAVHRTGAETLFVKPLALESVLAHVETVLAELAGPEAPTILKIYSSASIENAEMIEFIDEEPTLHAFHLPMLLQRIHDTNITGELTVISADGNVSSISFHNGRIFSAKPPDEESYFGSLAVSLGFVTPEDVLVALKNPVKKMLGAKLIESLSLSPHAIALILEEQLALRLSQCIHDAVMSLQWIAKKFPEPQYSMVDTRFEFLLEDWLQSKITFEWLKSTLMSWGNFQIEGDYHPRIKGTHTIEEVFSDANFNEERDIHALFQALVQGRAFMGARGEEVQDYRFLESRLDQMAADFKQQNLFQVLGLNEKAQARELTKAYEGLKEAFDPSRLPEGCPPEIKEKCVKVFAKIEKAKTVLGDDLERMRYIQHLQNKRGQELIDAAPIFNVAILELISGRHIEAGLKFQDLLDRKLDFKDLRAYRIWAGLNESRRFSSLRIDQIPPEERHSAPYMMAKGMYYRTRGQYKKAVDAFRTAHALDPRLKAAKLELRKLVHDLEQQRTGTNRELIRDVTSIVEGFLGKSKKGA